MRGRPLAPSPAHAAAPRKLSPLRAPVVSPACSTHPCPRLLPRVSQPRRTRQDSLFLRVREACEENPALADHLSALDGDDPTGCESATGAHRANCALRCVSEACWTEIYLEDARGWGPLEEGELDGARSGRFYECAQRDLRSADRAEELAAWGAL